MMSIQQTTFRQMLRDRGMEPRGVGPVTGELVMVHRKDKPPVFVFVNDKGGNDGYSLYFASLSGKIADDVDAIERAE